MDGRTDGHLKVGRHLRLLVSRPAIPCHTLHRPLSRRPDLETGRDRALAHLGAPRGSSRHFVPWLTAISVATKLSRRVSSSTTWPSVLHRCATLCNEVVCDLSRPTTRFPAHCLEVGEGWLGLTPGINHFLLRDIKGHGRAQ